MRREPARITLGGNEFEIRPLTLRQTRDIEVATAQKYPTNTDLLCAILDIVLKRDYAEKIPEGGVIDMEVELSELSDAAGKIRKLAGMEAAQAGEAKAASPAATSSGDTSTGG